MKTVGLKRVSESYDRFYEEADRLFREYNPCQFENGKCIFNRWCEDIYKKQGLKLCGSPSSKYTDSNGCCSAYNCKYLGPEGCTIKALGCKLFVCTWLFGKAHKDFYPKLLDLRGKAAKTMMISTQCYQDKEQFLTRFKEGRKAKREEGF